VEQRKDPSRGDHFSEQRWGDFVRGLADEDHRQEMQAHLESGCAQCLEIANHLGLVAKLGASDSAHEVPQDVLNHALGIFEPAPVSTWMDSLTPVIAELISSSRGDWQLAGVRSHSASVGDDRMLFRAGDYSVDLALDPPLAGTAGEIVGQIANELDQDEKLDGILVQMVVAGRTLGETSTNRFGEFLMDYPAKKNATLRFALKHRGQRIDLPLKLGDNT
jgi:hypothetical protein